MTPRTRTALITGAAVVALVVSGGVAYAVSSTPTSATTTASASPAPAKTKHHRQLLGHVAHGEVTLNGKDHKVVDVQRGDVQAVSATSISVKSDDGFTATYAVTSDTKIRKGGKQSAISDVHTGDKVAIVATKANGASTATRIGEK
jgi:Cu/Ag efflux protein CusF